MRTPIAYFLLLSAILFVGLFIVLAVLLQRIRGRRSA